jgi:predicted dehydrogenase
MADAARSEEVVTFVGFNYRWIPAISLARQLIHDGAIGEVVHLRIAKDSDVAADPARENWRFFASEAGGGSLADVGSHVFDLARSLAGDFEQVSGLTRIVIPERPHKGQPRAVDTDDMWMAMATFESGATGSFQGSRVLYGNKADFELEIAGTRGAIRWEQVRMNELGLYQPRTDGLDGFTAIRLGPEHPDHGRFVPVRGHAIGFGDLKTIEASRLAGALAGVGPAEPDFDDALAVARIIEAVPLRRWVPVGEPTRAEGRS